MVKNKQKITNFAPQNPEKFHSVALIFYREISNDFLMSYMIETDLPVCVLICLDVWIGQQDLILVKNKQKIADFVPQNPENSIMLP